MVCLFVGRCAERGGCYVFPLPILLGHGHYPGCTNGLRWSSVRTLGFAEPAMQRRLGPDPALVWGLVCPLSGWGAERDVCYAPSSPTFLGCGHCPGFTNGLRWSLVRPMGFAAVAVQRRLGPGPFYGARTGGRTDGAESTWRLVALVSLGGGDFEPADFPGLLRRLRL